MLKALHSHTCNSELKEYLNTLTLTQLFEKRSEGRTPIKLTHVLYGTSP
jgi:hypothetical protein